MHAPAAAGGKFARLRNAPNRDALPNARIQQDPLRHPEQRDQPELGGTHTTEERVLPSALAFLLREKHRAQRRNHRREEPFKDDEGTFAGRAERSRRNSETAADVPGTESESAISFTLIMQ